MRYRLDLTILLGTAVCLGLNPRPLHADVSPGPGGTYVYAGQGIVAGFPWDVRATLTLGADRVYRLLVHVNVKGESEQESDEGTFRVAGDRLVLTSSNGKDRQELIVRGDSLLTGEDWGFATQVAMRSLGVSRPAFVKEGRGRTGTL